MRSTKYHPEVPAPSRPRMPRSLRTLCLLAALVAGCSEPNRYVEPPPPEVTVVRPIRRGVTNYLEVTGTAQPAMAVDIRARVRGFLKERHFKEGSLVKEGQLLMVIDEVPFRLALDQARMRLAEAEAASRKAKQSRAREVAEAQLDLDLSQLNLARTAEARQRTLTGRGAGTREEMDTAEANRKKNEAQVEATRAQLDQAEADYQTNIFAAEANVGSARMMIRNAEIELGYCRMYAPIDGRISRINLHVGNLVGDGQASLLATIVKIDPIYAYTNVSESDLLRYRSLVGSTGVSGASEAAMPMELGLADERGYPHRGQADYQEPAADPGTGTIRRPGRLPQPRRRDPAGLLRPRPDPGRTQGRRAAGPRACPRDRPGRSVPPGRRQGRPRRVSPGQGGGAVRRTAGRRGQDRSRRPRRRRGAPPGPSPLEGHPDPRGEGRQGRRRRRPIHSPLKPRTL